MPDAQADRSRTEQAMYFSPRISTKQLAQLCRRLSTSLEAGIDVRTVWAREADRSRGLAARSRFRSVSQVVNRGGSLGDALSTTDDFFPEMFRELANVGEQTGHLGETFGRLAEHYEEQLRLRRTFLTACTWPLTELTFALAVVGLMIWIMGFIKLPGGQQIDPLGFGLAGKEGLVTYLVFLGVVGLGIGLAIRAIGHGLAWTRPIQRMMTRLPMLGGPIEAIALARLAWSLHLTLDAGMDVRQAVRLSLRSTRNARYTDHIESIDRVIRMGNPLYDAFLETGSFPISFLDTVRVGEETGEVVESMQRLSRQYQEQAEAAMKTLAVLGGFGVWLLVAGIIIMLIFRLASFYIGTLNEFMP